MLGLGFLANSVSGFKRIDKGFDKGTGFRGFGVEDWVFRF